MKLKSVLDTWIGKLKGKDRLETMENLSIFLIFVGAIVLAVGIGLTVVTKTTAGIMSMMGAFISFIFTIVLIFVWLIKEFKS